MFMGSATSVSTLTSFTLKKSFKKCVLSWRLKNARELH